MVLHVCLFPRRLGVLERFVTALRFASAKTPLSINPGDLSGTGGPVGLVSACFHRLLSLELNVLISGTGGK